MYETDGKKNLNMMILEILKEYSDSEHGLQQQEIIDLLQLKYGTTCERRAVKSNIVSLREMGYKIGTKKGYYLEEREFTDAELRLLIDGVFTSGAITDKEAHKLVSKLEKFSNKYFKSHVSYIHSTSSGMNAENRNVMDSIAAIDTAISKGKKIAFSYLQYGIDFKLHPKRNIRYVVNPYQMVNNKGKYYLIGNYDEHENVSHYRLDRITDVEILKENRKPMKSVKGLEKGFNIQEYISERVYMFSGESERFKLRTNENMMDTLVDSFGREFRVELGEGSDKMIDIIKKNKEKNIGIIVNHKSLNARYNSLRSKLPYDINIQMHKAMTDNKIDFDINGVKLLSFGTMKGLEFDIVLLPMFDKIEMKDGGIVDLNTVYVAVSRPLTELYLFYWNKRPSPGKIDTMTALIRNENLLEWK